MSSNMATTEPQEVQPLITGLPEDIALNILARTQRSQHNTLSLTSKPIKNLITSTLFFSTRLHLNVQQHLLYLCLRSTNTKSPNFPSLQYFTLTQNPHFTLAPIPPPLTPSPTTGAAFVSIGPRVYVIGGSIDDIASRDVWVLDCRFHKWGLGPRMRVAREFPAAGVVDGKVFVMGGCVADSFSRAENWAEVLDFDVGKWSGVSSPFDVKEKWMHASAVVKGRVYAMADRGGVVFDPKSGNWEGVDGELDLGWRGRGCVIDEVLYCYDFLGNIRGFDVEEGKWKELKGVEKGLPRFLCGATMANVGGKLVVLWEAKGSGNETGIWCAEIEVKKCEEVGELRGSVCWCDRVLRAPSRSSIVHCLAVTL